jgi:hypothetical protein
MPTCIVSYLDISGIRHTVEVEADSLYEAVVLGSKLSENMNVSQARSDR